MFKKTPQPQPQTPKRVGRHRMTFINGAPRLQDVRLLLSEAENQRGTLCELPIKTDRGVFLLSCQSDSLSTEPAWTLYEGEEGSQLLWNYMNANVEMISDIVNMSVTQGGGAVSLADLGLTPPASQEVAPEPPKAGGAMIDPNPFANDNNWSNAVDKPAPQVEHGMQQPGWVGQPNPFGAPATGWGQQPAQGWTAPQPASPFSEPAPAPAQSPFVQPAAAPQTASPFTQQAQPAAPQPVSPFTQPAQPNPAWNQAAQPGGWGEAAQQDPSLWQQQPAPAAQAWSAPDPFAPAQNPMANPVHQSNSGPSDYANAQADSIWKNPVIAGRVDAGAVKALIDSKPKSTMSELAMEPSFPPVISDAAMRLQEMVLKGHFNDFIAREALKLAAENGGILDDNVIAAARNSTKGSGGEYAAAAVVLLQHAQLLTTADIPNVEMMTPEAIVAAVQRTKKIDEQLFESAKECAKLIAQGRLQEHQGIMALHYCLRVRAKLEDAFEELQIIL